MRVHVQQAQFCFIKRGTMIIKGTMITDRNNDIIHNKAHASSACVRRSKLATTLFDM